MYTFEYDKTTPTFATKKAIKKINIKYYTGIEEYGDVHYLNSFQLAEVC